MGDYSPFRSNSIFGDRSYNCIYPIPQTLLEFQHFWNAAFEAFSGFTSTGLTVTLHENELPHSLQWWRSLTEWIGGVGMIVLVLSILEPSKDADQLYKAEARQQRIALTVTATVRRIWWIYLIYTGLSILLLYIAGMPLWDAINHGFIGISTGGFSIRDHSLGSYSPVIQLASALGKQRRGRAMPNLRRLSSGFPTCSDCRAEAQRVGFEQVNF